MQIQCNHVSTSEAGDEIYQILFEAERDNVNQPYLLIQRAWFEEDEGRSSTTYIECQNTDLCNHYTGINAELIRTQLIVFLPKPADEVIKVTFHANDEEYTELQRMLGIILNHG
jgi:hypothetical protein